MSLYNDIEETKAKLSRFIVQANERAELGRQSIKKVESVSVELKTWEEARVSVKQCIDRCTKLYKAVEKYAQDRKELSLELLKAAIEEAGYIVPDADVDGISLRVIDKTAKLVNKLGQDINEREGSAYRTVVAMMIRYALLKAQPDRIQVIFLDEAFSTLSETTQVAMRECIDVFSKNVLIVGIEQQGTVYSGLTRKVYRAIKSAEKETTIIDEGILDETVA